MEYRVRIVIEERRVSAIPDRFGKRSRSRWVKSGIGITAMFSEDFDEQAELYDRAAQILKDRDEAQRSQLLKELKI